MVPQLTCSGPMAACVTILLATLTATTFANPTGMRHASYHHPPQHRGHQGHHQVHPSPQQHPPPPPMPHHQQHHHVHPSPPVHQPVHPSPPHHPAPPANYGPNPHQYAPVVQQPQYVAPPQPVAQVQQYVPVHTNYVQPPPVQHYVAAQPLPAVSGNSIYQPMPAAAAAAQVPSTGFSQGGEYESEGSNSAASGGFYAAAPPQMSLLDSYYAPRQGAYQAHGQRRGGMFGRGGLFSGNNMLGNMAMMEWIF